MDFHNKYIPRKVIVMFLDEKKFSVTWALLLF